MKFVGVSEESELYTLFLEDADSYIHDFQEGLLQIRAGKGVSSLLRLLHTLKGNAATAGINLLTGFSHDLEQELIQYQNQEKQIPDYLLTALERAQNIIKACLYTEDRSSYPPLIGSLLSSLDRHKQQDAKNTQQLVKVRDPAVVNTQTNLQNTIIQESEATHRLTIKLSDTEKIPILPATSIQNLIRDKAQIVNTNPDLKTLSVNADFSIIHFNIVYNDTVSALYNMLASQVFVEDVTIVVLRKEKATGNTQNNKSDTLKISLKSFKKLESTATEVFEKEQKFNNLLYKLFDILQSHDELYKDIQNNIEISTSMLTNTKLDKELVTNSVYNINTVMQKLELQLQNAIIEFYGRVFTEITLAKEQLYNINRSVYNLWRLVAKTQMLPMKELFILLPPIVTRLSKELKKSVAIKFEGSSIMIDTGLLSRIHSSIVHCIQNSVDHGIEIPKLRKECGKNMQGTILISATSMGRQLRIDCIDDGCGIDIDKVRSKAIKTGHINETDVLSDEEILQLLFIPGFSTADSLSLISGRGIGLDVVKSEIESIGGSISLYSTMGSGTKLTLSIPLNMSIITCVIVKVGEEQLGIPFFYIQEMISTEGSAILDNSLMYNDKTIPLVNLCELYGSIPKLVPQQGYIIICKEREKFISIYVEGILSYQEVVVKSSQTKSLPEFILGTSTMLDGNMLLVVDLPVLFQYIEENTLQYVLSGGRVEYA